MTIALLPNGRQQFLDANGVPLVAGLVYTYVPATTTQKTTWSDSAGTVPNMNPIVLDAAGEASIYGIGDYRQLVRDSVGNTIWDEVTSAPLLTNGVAAGATDQLAYYAASGTSLSPLEVGSGLGIVSGPALAVVAPLDLNATIVVSGGLVPSNSAIFITATSSGTGTPGFGDVVAPAEYIGFTESITSLSPSSLVSALAVTHSFGTGEGARSAITGVLVNTAPTAGASADGHAFYTGVTGQTFVQAADGGTLGNEKGDFFGMGSIVAATSAATHLHGMIGAEHDISLAAGSSSLQKVALQLIFINEDAVQGSEVDAGLLISGDNTALTGVDFGIVFGKPGNVWVTNGTLIGTYTTTNPMNANFGIDFSAVNFVDPAGGAFKSPGFLVSPIGIVECAATQSEFVVFQNTTPPSTPASGQFALWYDLAGQVLNGINSSGVVTTFGGGGGGGGSGTVASSTIGTIPIYTGATTVTGNAAFAWNAGALSIGDVGTQGSVKLSGTTSGTVTLGVGATAGTYSLTLPANGGTNGEFLQTNGSGTTTWASPSGTGTVGSGTTAQIAGYATSGTTVGGVAGVFASGGQISLGVNGTSQGELELFGATSGNILIATKAVAGAWTLVLPNGAGSNGQFLQTDGTGVLAWASATGSGTVSSALAGQMGYYSAGGNTISGNANVTVSSGVLTLGQAGSVAGQLKLSGSSSGTITVTGGATAGTYTLTLPGSGGSSGQYLQTNGSGTTSWVTPINAGTTAQLAYYAGSGNVLSAVAAVFASGGQISVGVNGVAQGAVELFGSSSGTAFISTRAVAGTTNFILPVGNGSNGQALTTDGSGNTSWSSVGAGTVTAGTGGYFTLYGSSGTVVKDASSLVSGGASVRTGGWSTAVALEGIGGDTTWGISGYNSGTSGTGSGAMMARVDDTSQALVEFFYSGASTVGLISTDGSSTTYGTSSDVRLKHDIEDMGDVGELIDAIAAKVWKWNDSGKDGQGFIAQDVYKLVPDAVGRIGDDDLSKVPGDAGFIQWSLDYSKLVPIMMREIQELRKRVKSLESGK